ncbi:MAG TPA: MmcQ/YjbR family DNA-binding protein [Chryseolinea sp.]
MDVETLRNFCNALPAVREDIKWGNDLCFTIGEKMFCVVGLDSPHRFSFKVTDEEFDEVSTRDGFIPAPYMARNKWVSIEYPDRVKQKDWEYFVRQSYELIKANLTRKARVELGVEDPGAEKPAKAAPAKKKPVAKKVAVKKKLAAKKKPAAKKKAPAGKKPATKKK